jgi:alpha-beta hydrolase superfamily lysophospholipase
MLKALNNSTTSTLTKQEFLPMIESYFKVNRIPFPLKNNINLMVRDKKTNKTLKLATYEYPTKEKQPKAVLFSVPSYGISSEHEGYFFKAMAENGIAVHTFDRRGFGLSEGKRGAIDEQVFDDYKQFFDIVS